MTINAPAALLLLLYELVAEEQGVRGRAAPRHGPERHPQGVHRARELHLPAAALDAADDRPLRLLRRAAAELEHDLDLRLPHPRGRLDGGAGARLHARERDRLLRRPPSTRGSRRTSSASGSRSSSTRTTTSSRRWRSSARRGGSGREIMRERFGATNPKAQALRFHAQTGGSTLTAQQPENNIVRVAIQALSAVCGGAQSIHTNSFDEALALPTERAARIALRTQQILAHEAGGTDTADPLGGSYFIEALTDELEARARELIERVDELGGAVAAVEQGFVQGEIEDAAFRYSQRGRVRRARDRRRQPLRGGRARSRSSCTGSTPRPSGASSSARRGCGPSGTRRGGRGGARRACGEAARGTRTCSRRCARRCARAARSARSATCCARSSACTTRSARRADPARLADVPGPGRPGPRRLRAADRAGARASAGTRSSAPCSTRAAAASGATRSSRCRTLARGAALRAGRRLRALPRARPACSPRWPARRRSSSPRTGATSATSARSAGSATRDARDRAPRRGRDRRLGLPAPRARGEGAGGARQDGGGRLRRRPRALPASSRRPRAGPRFLCVGALTERKNVVRLADAFARLGEGTLTFVGDGPLRAQLEGRERVELAGVVPHDEMPALDRAPRTSSASRA